MSYLALLGTSDSGLNTGGDRPMAGHRRVSRHRTTSLVAVATTAVLTTALLQGQTASAAAGACDSRNNNTYEKLLECVTLEGVREHQAALQKIADNSTDPVYPGTRAAGTVGYDESVEYVAGLLRDAGYEVTLDPVDITFNFPAELRQLTPVAGRVRDRRLHRQRLGDGPGQRHPGRHQPHRRPRPRPAAARRPTSPASTGAEPTTSRSSNAARASSAPRPTTPSRPAPRRSSSSTRATRLTARR